MEVWIGIGFFLLAFIGMEGVAWFAHKYVMHGFLWNLHEDHHKPDASFFEKNDYFFLIFAIPGIACFVLGLSTEAIYAFWIGLGITVYGAAYFFIHDIFIHQRFKILRNANSPYFRAIRRAHKIHHKHLSKEDGECFGMLWVPMKYYQKAKNQKR